MHSAMIRQILAFHKKAFDDSFNAVLAVQQHSEKMVHDFWEKSSYFPEEGKKIADGWVATYKKGLEEFRANVDSRFKLVEDFLVSAADQMESSFGAAVDFTGSAKPKAGPVPKETVASESPKAVPRKTVTKRVKAGRKKKDQSK